jgi:hypothetical protein
MGFGPFRVKAKFGEQRIATSAGAMAFMRSLEPSRRTSYQWKVAERMIHFAWMSAEDEASRNRQRYRAGRPRSDLCGDRSARQGAHGLRGDAEDAPRGLRRSVPPGPSHRKSVERAAAVDGRQSQRYRHLHAGG